MKKIILSIAWLLFLVALPACQKQSESPADETTSIRVLANQGQADAQLKMGRAYADGDGVSQNYTEAARWFRKAAVQGLADAQFYLGYAYLLIDQ